jgi:hypothetical protein
LRPGPRAHPPGLPRRKPADDFNLAGRILDPPLINVNFPSADKKTTKADDVDDNSEKRRPGFSEAPVIVGRRRTK